MAGRIDKWPIDPDDPRAPSHADWDAMDRAQRAQVVMSLPTNPIPLQFSPEGDRHYYAVKSAEEALWGWYRRRGLRAYVAVNKAIYYPEARCFSPDVFVVLNVDAHPRESWIVSNEGSRGLDFVLEILHHGNRAKDLVGNVERYARLGISEYFVFDVGRQQLRGWRLPETGEGRYERLIQQGGLLNATLLDLELGLVDGRLRFFAGGA